MSGMILFETSNIINGNETNYIMATGQSVCQHLQPLLMSLLQLLGFLDNE